VVANWKKAAVKQKNKYKKKPQFPTENENKFLISWSETGLKELSSSYIKSPAPSFIFDGEVSLFFEGEVSYVFSFLLTGETASFWNFVFSFLDWLICWL
jgi:hypothetical protein